MGAPQAGFWSHFAWMGVAGPRDLERVPGAHAGASPTGLGSARPQIEAADTAQQGQPFPRPEHLPPHTRRAPLHRREMAGLILRVGLASGAWDRGQWSGWGSQAGRTADGGP